MHCHQSLWKDGAPLFYDEVGYAGLSDTARYYIAGCLHHAPSLLAFTNPTLNSYHRLVPGFEAPVNLVYSQRNRFGLHPHPDHGQQPEGEAPRVPLPRPVSNPYWRSRPCSWPASTESRTRSSPCRPSTRTSTSCPGRAGLRAAGAGFALRGARRPEKDHDYLLEGGVFTADLIETWIEYKRTAEIDAIRLRPHPYEFALYYDI